MTGRWIARLAARKGLDLRPVGYTLGWAFLGLGLMMVAPLVADLRDRDANASALAVSSLRAVIVGGSMALAAGRT